MKKRVVSVLLSTCLVAGMLAGCGSKTADTTTTTAEETTEDAESTDAADETVDATAIMSRSALP